MERASGVLMHISSLYGDYSTGAFGNEAKEFIDFLADCGFKYWQVLPFTVVDECNSPYKSYSAFAGNPYFVDLNILANKGLITTQELEEHKQNTPYSCEYEYLYNTRFKLLKTAAMRVKDKSEIEQFICANKNIADFCKFMALKAANDDLCWTQWKSEEIDAEVLFAWQFIQYEFFSQWKKIKTYANAKNVKIIGDIPIFVAYDSSDVWANSKQFQLDEKNMPKCVAGVPPDYFSEDGQLWGNPLYDWDYMKKDGYKWWTERMNLMLELFDGVRIDHFRGLEAYYSIPYGSINARNGQWVKGPGKDFVDVLKALAGDKLIIAEDLGEITNEVVELVNYSTFPGMRVLQFGFLGDGDSIHKPHHYINNSVAYTGTHDNNTLLGYVWELDEDKRQELLEYCGYSDLDWDKCYDSIIRTLYASNAGIVIFPIQDLLGYGSDTRLNTPGKAEGNWLYRITKEQLMSIDRNKYKKWNRIYNR